ncbi:MAG: hypothetical protein O3C10_02900 [Chloroflexi bacterium]|nr:hypothetical protein [Chloroflexota bacterium]
MRLARQWPTWANFSRTFVFLFIAVLALIALAACSADEANPAQSPDTDTDAAQASGAAPAQAPSGSDAADAASASTDALTKQAESDLAVRLDCSPRSADGRLRYPLDVATRSDVRERSELKATRCTAHISGGQPDFRTGFSIPFFEFALEYETFTIPDAGCSNMRKLSDEGSTSCTIGFLFPQPPGMRDITLRVTDSLGDTAEDAVEVEYYWDEPERIDVTFTSHEEDALVALGESVPFSIEYKADKVALAEQEGLLSEFNLIPGLDRFLVEWEFDSGATASETTDTISGVSTMPHSFTGSGDIRVIRVNVTDQIFGMTGSVKRRVGLLGPPFTGALEISGPDRLPPRVFTVDGTTLTPDPALVEAIIATGRYDGTFGFPGLACKVEVSEFEGGGTYDPSTRAIKGSWSIAYEYAGVDALPCRDLRGELTRSIGIALGSTPPFTNTALAFDGVINSRGIGNVDVTFEPDGPSVQYDVSPG